MRLLLLIGILFFSVSGNSQSGFKIFYETDMSDIPLIINGHFVKRPLSHSRIVFNDSMSFSYGLGTDTKDPMKKSKNYGSKVIHHSVLSFKNSDICYIGVANSRDKKSFFVLDTLKKQDWTFTNDSKLIVGFKCKKAFCIKSGTDSLFAWYTDEIPLPFGPTRSRGLPGLVLEIYEQTYNGVIHTTAIKIEKEDFTIGVSAGIKVIPRTELKKGEK